jgi:prepilin-type N-terminal cleavage/methylation domain-containing protein
MKKNRSNPKLQHQRGFSLVETIVVVALLLLVLGVATDGLIQMQKRTSADTGKVDTTQMSRQFLDQIVNDLHQTGYPSGKLFDPNSNPSANSIAVGLITVDANDVEFEADVDGSGNVSHVWLQLIDSTGAPISAGSTCPCTLQRGTLYKQNVGATVPYYTEVNNVTNTNIFSAYAFDGTAITLPALAADLQRIKNIKITVNLQSTVQEPDGVYPTITMASEAKISNN